MGPNSVEDLTVQDVTEVASDCEHSEQEASSGDDSTDIDAVVKEYQDRVQVFKIQVISINQMHFSQNVKPQHGMIFHK